MWLLPLHRSKPNHYSIPTLVGNSLRSTYVPCKEEKEEKDEKIKKLTEEVQDLKDEVRKYEIFYTFTQLNTNNDRHNATITTSRRFKCVFQKWA